MLDRNLSGDGVRGVPSGDDVSADSTITPGQKPKSGATGRIGLKRIDRKLGGGSRWEKPLESGNAIAIHSDPRAGMVGGEHGVK